jgi:hypothetical protein
LPGKEWSASRSPDEENAEREMRQFRQCLPTVPLKWDQTGVEARCFPCAAVRTMSDSAGDAHAAEHGIHCTGSFLASLRSLSLSLDHIDATL